MIFLVLLHLTQFFMGNASATLVGGTVLVLGERSGVCDMLPVIKEPMA